MYDLHCHILPGLDDGAPDDTSAIAMARELCELGFTHVATSPHLGEGPGGDVDPALAQRGRHTLSQRLRECSLGLELLPGSEHHVTPALFDRIHKGLVVPIGGQSTWLLVELPWQGIPDLEGVLFRLQLTGYKLVLAHPERYLYLEPDTALRLVARGIKLQLELGSFVGLYGKRAKSRAEYLMKHQGAHLLATDLHRPQRDRGWLEKALNQIASAYGAGVIEVGLRANPQAFIADASVEEIAILEHAAKRRRA